ncbi:MAG: 2TM domain-containing protein [Fimbriimonadaceae bacterium]|nr:2TM domain-containing protein [Fimbriimonadaceae bacterium]
MSDNQFYNDHEAEEILRLASRDDAVGGMTKDRLIQTAAELGISPDAVLRAEEQLVKKREADRIAEEEKVLREQFTKERRRSFGNDLATYVFTNLLMIGIWWMTGHGYFWPIWVILGWGLGVASDFYTTFFNQDEAKFQRWKRRRHRSAMGAVDMSTRAEPILDELVTASEISKIQAIKELRERLNLDLRDAKDMADAYETKNPGVFR